MARVIKKNNQGEVIVKQESKFKKFIKKIKPIHFLYAWNIVATALLITLIVFICVRFWPNQVEVREKNTIENRITEYVNNLGDNEAKVEVVLAEDLQTIDINTLDQLFIYAYNPDVENCSAYYELNSDGSFKLSDKSDENSKISNNLYEQNSKIIIDLIDKLETGLQDNMWNTKLYVIDLTKKSNQREITNIGGIEVSIDLTNESLAQGLYLLNTTNEKCNTIGSGILNSNLRNSIINIQASLYKYTYTMHFNDMVETVTLSYQDILPMSSSYTNDELKDLFYNADGKAIYDWFEDEAMTDPFDPNDSKTNKVDYININGTIKTEYHYYGKVA